MKLNIHRFEDTDALTFKFKTESDTNGLKVLVKSTKDAENELKKLSTTDASIKTNGIVNATNAVLSFKNALNSLAGSNTKYTSALNSFKAMKSLPVNARSSDKRSASAAKSSNMLNNFLSKSTMPQLDMSNIWKIGTPIDTNLQKDLNAAAKLRTTDLYKNYQAQQAQQAPVKSMMNNVLTGVLSQSMLPQLDTTNAETYKSKMDDLKQTIEEMANNSLKNLYNGLKDTDSELSNADNNANKATESFKKLWKEFREGPTLVDKLSKSFNKMDFTKLVNLWRTVKRVSSTIVDMVESAAGYEESLNLYTMALGKYANEAKVWAKSITDNLKLDPSQVMQYTGAFFNLVKGMNVGAEDAYLMSKNLTQLTYDMASYLNISNEAAQAKIQSAMAGQSRAVASVGVATQVASLQELAYSMNIKKKVANMTQAEKTYLRYIQLMRSTEQMQGDLGRTMITPANAIRTLKNQITLLGRAVGQVLTPFIMQAIPYVIALTNVLTRLASALAGKFGYKVTDINYDAFAFEEAETGVNNLNDLSKAASKAGKSVQNSLAPFDELNVVISEASGVGSSAGSGSGDLIDPSIWKDALPQYDMLKDYTDDLVKKAQDLEGSVSRIVTIIGLFVAGKVISTIIRSIADVVTSFKTIHDLIKSMDTGLNTLTGTSTNLASKLLAVASSIVLAYESVKLAKAAVENVSQGNEKLGEAEAYGSVTSGAAAGAITGFAFGGPLGAAFGALLGGVTAMKEVQAEADKIVQKNYDLYAIGMGQYNYEYAKTIELIDKFNSSYERSRQLIIDSASAKLDDLGYYEGLYNRLQQITDENGNILEGHKNEASFIVEQLNTALGTNIELRKGQVIEIDKVKKSVEKLLEKQKAEIKLEAMREQYKQAILNEAKAVATLSDAEDNLRAAKELVAKASGKSKEAQLEAQAAYDEANKRYNAAFTNYTKTITDKERYEKAMVAFTKGNYEELNKIYDQSATEQLESFEDCLAKMTSELKGGPLTDELILAWRNLADSDAEAYNKALEKIGDDETRAKIVLATGRIIGPVAAQAIGLGDEYSDNFTKTVEDNLKNDPIKVEVGVNKPETWWSKFKKDIGTTTINADVESKSNVGNLLSDLLSGAKNVVKNVLKFTFKAGGGFVDSGDLFFANENGVPEYITSVGNKSAVINQNQMVQTLTNAIAAGFDNFGGNLASNVTVYVGDKKLYEGQGEYQNRQNDRYGTTVVRI